MADIIKLLPDNIANQIAAGEVIQRPSNIVKELIENSIDAKSNKITIIIEDGGIKSIQVIDNGIGMSETDSRLCFERHATSKINNINDIFKIKTMGFRGEALSSIVSVATITLKTKLKDNEVGTLIEIEDSKILKQEPIMCNNGTNIHIKNLFFNLPARKNFLKSDKKELDYIIEEFIRIAIPFNNVSFELISNSKTIYNLIATNNKNRILQIYKNYYSESNFININEKYNDFKFNGFLGKPEISRNIRGHQFFFINNRFIKNNYLAHAVSTSFETLIKKEQFPTYFIFIEIDTNAIDINVHPTKQEIKFQDDKLVYSFLCSALKHTFSKYAVSPSIDFEIGKFQNQYISLQRQPTEDEKNNILNSNLYKNFTKPNQAHYIENYKNENIEKFYEKINLIDKTSEILNKDENNLFPLNNFKNEDWLKKEYLQLENEYIITTYNDNLIIINQQLAHQVILYEKYIQKSNINNEVKSQTLLFPINFKLSIDDAIIFEELLDELKIIGYNFIKNKDESYSIISIPIENELNEINTDIEKIIQAYRYLQIDINVQKKEKIIRCLCLKNSIKIGVSLKLEEMRNLSYQLFNCSNPFYTYGNIKTFIIIEKNKIDKLF